MYFIVIFFIILPLYCPAFAARQHREFFPINDPILYYNMIEMVCNEGYYIQEHTVLTEDGYMITVYRIPGGKRHPKVPRKKYHFYYVHRYPHPDFKDCVRESMNETTNGPPVLFSHGLGAASDCWISQGPKWDLAYMLADKGYDVWLSNVRGNFYSKRHKTLKTSEKVFWDFSFHENGVYDMTGTIDYILNMTGFQKLYYVGHSMGTTMFFIMTSVRPEYNDKIILFAGLAPVGFLSFSNYKRPLQFFDFLGIPIANIFLKNGALLELFPRHNLASFISRLGCTMTMGRLIQNICADLVFILMGVKTKAYLRDRLAVFLTHSMSGCSMKSMAHYGQMLSSEKFRYFDYGPKENIRRYSQTEPPNYDYNKVTARVALFYSQGDYIEPDADVEKLKSRLPNVVAAHKYPNFNHIDYIWSFRAKSLIYEKVLELFEKYGNSTNPESVRLK